MLAIRDGAATYNMSELPTSDEVILTALDILAGRLRYGEPLTQPSAAENYLRLKIGGSERELFYILFLDNRHRVIAEDTLFMGTIDSSEVHPREVIKATLKHNAAAVIISHNHPSGMTEPSAADRAITQRLREALDLIGVRMLDHIIVSPHEATSLANRGWI
jgi:DNA repair protein RadC